MTENVTEAQAPEVEATEAAEEVTPFTEGDKEIAYRSEAAEARSAAPGSRAAVIAAAAATGRRWISEQWKTRRGKLYLAPGDSAAGYRLPLSSLRHLSATSYPHVVPVDPGIPRPPLPDPGTILAASVRPQTAASFTASTETQNRNEQVLDEIDSNVRTALTVEVRHGRLCVFLPPVAALEDYLELIEATDRFR